ncbi:hypothetical protein ACP4OV_002273 [Aristida adscensionis]
MASSSSSSSSSLSVLVLLCLTAAAATAAAQLSPTFYTSSCPGALATIKAAVTAAVAKEPRMGASLLRLHFHDCFVQGCDASVLLSDTASFTGEQGARPNAGSLRGFAVVDSIKAQVEAVCKQTVSCADILAVAARDSVVALGGPSWTVLLGRRDSTTASMSQANSDLPAPSLSLANLTAAFAKKGLSTTDLVALSGAHTIGQAQCTNFRARIYNESTISAGFAAQRRAGCPAVAGNGDGSLAPLDAATANAFDNAYYTNLVNQQGLLHSDQQLLGGGGGGATDGLVRTYAASPACFGRDFAAAMVRMGSITPLTGAQGQVRLVCSKVN